MERVLVTMILVTMNLVTMNLVPTLVAIIPLWGMMNEKLQESILSSIKMARSCRNTD